jgi:hypothetical protein
VCRTNGMGDHASMEKSMFHQIAFCAALVTLAMVGSSFAQPVEKPNDVPMPPVIELPEQVYGTFGIDLRRRDRSEVQLAAGRPTNESLNKIADWLSTNFDLPGIQDLPRIELVPAARLASLRYKGLLSDQWRESNVNDPAARADFKREVVAVYDDSTKTIFLSESWTGSTPAEQSVLVHEMVHHMQNLGKFKYECPRAREKLAYEAQNEWLKIHGLEFEKEFEIDMLMVIVLSACMN